MGFRAWDLRLRVLAHCLGAYRFGVLGFRVWDCGSGLRVKILGLLDQLRRV